MHKLFHIGLVALTVLLVGFFFGPSPTARAATVNAGGLGPADAIITDSAGNSVAPGTVFSKWANYQVSYNWSIPDDVTIASGDTVAVTLPEGLVADTDLAIPLTDGSGNVIGTFTVKAGELVGTITFNEKAAAATKDRKGTLNFYAKGTNNTGSTGNDWKINKIGWIGDRDTTGAPTAITWNVAFNAAGDNLGHVVVTDTLGPNQTFIPASQTANTGSYNANGDFVADGGHLNPTVTVNGRTVTFTFDNVTKAVDMTYRVNVTSDPKGSTWTNTASVNGNSVNTEVAWGGSGTGSGVPDLGKVTLTKAAAETNLGLAGAVFSLRDGTGNVIQSGLTTNAAGQLLVDNLPNGDYSFIETAAPLGYILNTTPINFTITNGNAIVSVNAVDHPQANEGGPTPPSVTPPTTGPDTGGTTPPTTGPDTGGNPTPPTGPDTGTTTPGTTHPGTGGSTTNKPKPPKPGLTPEPGRPVRPYKPETAVTGGAGANALTHHGSSSVMGRPIGKPVANATNALGEAPVTSKGTGRLPQTNERVSGWSVLLGLLALLGLGITGWHRRFKF